MGQEKKVFRVHKDLICGRVSYFDKMFSGGFKEAQEQAATLPEDDIDAFALFVKWLYAGELPSARELRNFKTDTDRSFNETSLSNPEVHVPSLRIALLRLHVFAEKICETELADYVMTTLLDLFRTTECPSVSELTDLYPHTTPESPLRKFIVHYLHFHLYCKVNRSNLGVFAGMFAAALDSSDELATDIDMRISEALATGKRTRNPIEHRNCYFHLHASGQYSDHC